MKIYFRTKDELIPAIIQDARTKTVLMLGYMNEEAYLKTKQSQKVTFYSRSRNKLWTKGESSGNFLELKEIRWDCDKDTLLIKAIPTGPVCHTGDDTCFKEQNPESLSFFDYLTDVIDNRKTANAETSYTAKLFSKGINKIAQKVGEEAVEFIIEAKDDNNDLFLNEAADLVYHIMVLLSAKNKNLTDVVEVLKNRHKK